MKGEVLAGPERRRRWGLEEKAAIVAEAMVPDAKVSEIARRHGVSRSLLYTWRRERGQVGPTAELPGLVPVVMTNTSDEATPPVPERDRPYAAKPDAMIEIMLPSGVRVTVRGRVEERALRAVLGALRSA
jgi:transposase